MSLNHPIDVVGARARSGARLVALMVIASFLVVLAAELRESGALPVLDAVLLAFLALPCLGAAIAWRRERIGSMVLKLGAGVAAVFAWVAFTQMGLCEGDLLAATQLIVVLAATAGLLFLHCDGVGRRTL